MHTGKLSPESCFPLEFVTILRLRIVLNYDIVVFSAWILLDRNAYKAHINKYSCQKYALFMMNSVFINASLKIYSVYLSCYHILVLILLSV